MITNPPFRLAKEFILRALPIARRGVAIIARTSFIEGIDRYRTIFVPTPMTIFAPFVERVPMVKGRLDSKASTATSYGWLVWQKESATTATKVTWIPPCRKRLEEEGDYEPLRPPGEQAHPDVTTAAADICRALTQVSDPSRSSILELER